MVRVRVTVGVRFASCSLDLGLDINFLRNVSSGHRTHERSGYRERWVRVSDRYVRFVGLGLDIVRVRLMLETGKLGTIDRCLTLTLTLS